MSALKKMLDEIQKTDNFKKLEQIAQDYNAKYCEYESRKEKSEEFSKAIPQFELDKNMAVDPDTTLDQIDAMSRKNAAIDIKISATKELITKNNKLVESLYTELQVIAKNKNQIVKQLWWDMKSLCENEIKQIDTELFGILDCLRTYLGYGSEDLNRLIKWSDSNRFMSNEINKFIPNPKLGSY